MRALVPILTVAALAAGAAAAPALASGFHPGSHPPAGAQPGQCFGKVTAPGRTERWSERVLVRPAHDEVRRTAPVTRWIEKRELVRAAWTETHRIPALYRTDVSYVTEPGRMRTVRTPPRYRTVTERVLVSPARVVWQRGRAAGGFGEGDGYTRLTPTGEVWCRVRVPARYITRVHRVLVEPGCACQVQGPPVHRRVAQRVLVRPESVSTREHPAVYRTVRHCEQVSAGRSYVAHVPAVYRTVHRTRSHTQAGWAQVVCPDGLAPWAMARMQAALNARGYEAGPEDGVGRPETYAALRRWQRDNHMPAGQVTADSARALGVIR